MFTYQTHLPSNLTAQQLSFAELFGADLGGSEREKTREAFFRNAQNARKSVELGATTISNNADLEASRVGFHAAFLASFTAGPDPVEALALEYQSNGRSEAMNWMGDAPQFEEWKGERKMSGMDAFKLGPIENKDWSNGIRIKANDFKDDKLGLLPAQVKALAAKARLHRSQMLIDLLVAGFSTGLGYDGGLFFNTTRATGSNKLTSALDATSLAAADLLLASVLTYDGLDTFGARGTHLVVGPKLRATAEKILTQEYLASGESNSNRGGYQLIVSQRLRGTADDYWFLADLSSPIKPLLFQMREEISTSAQIAPETDNVFGRNEYRYGAQARYNVGYFEHRLIVGSQVV